MCGIAGLYCLESACGGGDDHGATVEGMVDIQAHRGPDDHGTIDLGRVCFGACRLSIIDLSPAGHMPMSDASGRWWITYNGEIYNFAELRPELAELGHTFHSRTDTEVALHAFMEWGEQCIERFTGMFAFAIYDREEEDLVLVRDRLGVKPLYYRSEDGHLLFASEIKALVPRGGSIDRARLAEWFLYRDVDSRSTGTLFEGIRAVQPGSAVRISRAGIATRSVYRLVAQVSEEEYGGFESTRRRDVIDAVDSLLSEATRLRLVSDVPVGTLLSGGLDSSLVTAIAASNSRDFTAFHVSVAGFPNLDERRFAEELARSLDLELISHELTGRSFRRELARAVYHSDLPLSHPNSVAYYLICRVSRDHGVKVLLSGEGADELFGGYSWRYRRRWYLLRAERFFRLLPNRLWQWLALVTYTRAGMPADSMAFRELLPPSVSFLDRFERNSWHAECSEAYSFVERSADREVLGSTLADLNQFLSPLLRRLDRMSMAASVECRVPYLDHRLIHTVVNLPLDYRIGQWSDKWVLKQVATRYIPRNIARRRKAGFPLPLDRYIGPLAVPEFFADGFCQRELGFDKRGMGQFLDTWRRWTLGFFGLLTLEIWGRLFIDGHDLEEMQRWIQRFEPED